MQQLAQAVVDTTQGTAQNATQGAGQGAVQGFSAPDLAAPMLEMSGELSIWGLFMQADPVVKVVMLLLILASIWSWAIIFEKVMKMRRLRRRASDFEDAFWSGGSLEDLYDRMGGQPADPMGSIFASAMREWRRSAAKGLTQRSTDLRASLRDRLEQIMSLTISREMEALEKRMTFLASVGSTAPFVGLFGTVWGIMNSFQAIAASKNSSLAVVAPGIAEALFATALGLVAAIPAVVAYNKLSSDLDRYASRLDGFATEFGSILSRQLDEGN
jgi:biopolymer transport protein TolQ